MYCYVIVSNVSIVNISWYSKKLKKRGKTKIHIPSCPEFGSHSKGKSSCPSRLSLVELIAQLGNCIPFLTLLADLAIGQGYPLVTLQLIHLSTNTLLPSPRNKQKQEFPLARLCLFSSTSSLSCVLTYVIGRFHYPYPPWKGTS